MAILQHIHPAWIDDEGNDVVPRENVHIDPLRIIATIASCVDAAVESIDTERMSENYGLTWTPRTLRDMLNDAPDLLTASERDEIDERSRVLAYRIMSRADREQRAAHTWWTDPRGDESPVAPAPDPFERVRSARKTRRTNSGRTEQLVTAHGRAYVVGALAPAGPHPAAAMSVERLTAALDTAARTVHGRDGIAVSRLTDAIYPDLPRLIGADTVSFEEFGAWDETRARTPRRGHATRYRLPTVFVRTGEQPAPRATFADHAAVDVPAWEPATIARLLAPDADPAYAWRGHVRHVRPITVRETRALTARPVDESITADPTTLAETLLTIARCSPDTWRATFGAGDMAGVLTINRGKRDRYRVRGLPGDSDIDTRTPDAMARRVAAAVAAAQ